MYCYQYDLIIYSIKELISAKSHIGNRKRIVVGPEKKCLVNDPNQNVVFFLFFFYNSSQ